MTILIPKHREILRDIAAPAQQVSGHFRIVARSARYKGERVLADFNNLILDAGLQRLLGDVGIGNGYIQLGTGTTTPANAQTSLVTYSSSIATLQAQTNSYVPGPPTYTQTVLEYRGTVGGNTGTFYEIGIGWASVGSLLSRALILDGGGSPNPITVLSDEQLSVYYTFRWYTPTTDATGTITINGSSYNWTARASDVDEVNAASYLIRYGLAGRRFYAYDDFAYGSDATLGPTTGIPSSTSSQNSTDVNFAYTSPNTYTEFISTFGPTATPVGGVGAILTRLIGSGVSGSRGIQTSFVPPIPKTNVQTLTLTTRASLTRYP